MANTERNGLFEGDLTEQPSRTLSITDRTGTDPYANKPFESKIWAPRYVVLPGSEEEGNIPTPSGNGLSPQWDNKESL